MARIPVAREGYPFILAALFCIIVIWIAGLVWLELFFAPLGVFVLAFFRDPERVVPADANAIISPADGKVIKVERVRDEKFLKAEVLRICIFMNVFNVHVNRVPASGRVVDVIYNPGKFFNASLDKASLHNEQNAVIMEAENGRRFAFNQIAGLIARRIVCYAKAGMSFEKGQRFGLIRFGSRVDVYLPAGCTPTVKVGEKVRAGSSILGCWDA
ncbi:MAG TPA: phosphatidylserine decarboxylase family protein [Deltaproteobacteria bacterium]|nr:MAG: phosphatidylserine decarboxylase [Deltaproteobacteria bacterium GWA2_55_82]OGQ63274.1 MAG: phosphatidylserine decarboxylase [Deltaproteobacteria bacterium RIFCSPLOWO2_02_FULL_55_12]OIJ73109.1 MAG: phosphatidylserine decarboxylase [Deltaproteobacteria bacterium GWC2_55_46]HBG47875.1 phosphatidylserine decarboxylase family protein [Deltaproteobacteria bacterium]HCY11862.1 phosphatidylserine decarboxylase family protein [Deltaproteobacteria bacterium]